MSKTSRLIQTTFIVYNAVVDNLTSIWLDQEDLSLIKDITCQDLNAVMKKDDLWGIVPVMEYDSELGQTHCEVHVDSNCVHLVTAALKAEAKSGRTAQLKLFSDLPQLKKWAAERDSDTSRYELDKIKAKWSKCFFARKPKDKMVNTKPGYKLVYYPNATPPEVRAFWLDGKTPSKKLELKMNTQVFNVFQAAVAKATRNDQRFLCDADLAKMLYKRPVDLTDPRVKANIRRWVCEFNKTCRTSTNDRSRPIIRTKSSYLLTVSIKEF